MEEVPLILLECPSLGLIFPRLGARSVPAGWGFVSISFSSPHPPEWAQAAGVPFPSSCFWPTARTQSLCLKQFRAPAPLGFGDLLPLPQPRAKWGPEREPPSQWACPPAQATFPPKAQRHWLPGAGGPREGRAARVTRVGRPGGLGGAGPSSLESTEDPQPCPGRAVTAAPGNNVEPRPQTGPHGQDLSAPASSPNFCLCSQSQTCSS